MTDEFFFFFVVGFFSSLHISFITVTYPFLFLVFSYLFFISWVEGGCKMMGKLLMRFCSNIPRDHEPRRLFFFLFDH